MGYDNLSNWGTVTPATFYWTGKLAWASVFSVALTSAQVNDLYDAGS